MPRSLQSTSATAPLCWHTCPSSGDDLECDTDLHFLPSCGICFSFLQRILAHQNFGGVRNLTRGRHILTTKARLCVCRRSRHGRRRLFAFELSLLRPENSFKRLEFLLFHKYFNTTPTRRVLCLTLHPHPRDFSAQHPRTRF